MSMSADLRDRLIEAEIAGGAVYRDELPQGSPRPCVILQVISDPHDSTYDGRISLRDTTVQCDCQATSRGEADEIAGALIVAAEPAGTVGATKFSRSFVDNVRTYSARDDKSGNLTFVTSIDLIVWHQPAA